MTHKHIVLCSDGTGNADTAGRGTNVFKLYEAVDIHGHKSDPERVAQVAFYDDGVGTENFAVHRMLGAAFGYGFAQNIRDLYTELVHVYVPGDKLFLFGFSRGAYTIRALAGMIQFCGVLRREKFTTEAALAKSVRRCWKEFEKDAFPRFATDRKRRSNTASADERAAARRRESLGSYPPQPEIEFIGVWDTVGAVGMPIDELKTPFNWICPRKFNELTPGPHVRRARHALSIDDERRTFRPELWNEAGALPDQVEQVWFAGVHSNVGGGYPKHGMSLVALDWMMSEVEARGLRFIPAAREYVRAQQDVHDKLYDSRAGYAVYYRWEPRSIEGICSEHNITPKLHISVFERIAHTTDGYAPGNIPANLEIVETRGAPKSPRLAQVQTEVRDRLKASNASSLQELPDMRFAIQLGSATYFLFLGLTLLALYWGLPGGSLAGKIGHIPELFTSTAAVWNFAKNLGSAGWWLLPGLLLCYIVSGEVDSRMQNRYSDFWIAIRASLNPWGATAPPAAPTHPADTGNVQAVPTGPGRG